MVRGSPKRFNGPMTSGAIVYIVDDEVPVQKAFARLMHSAGLDSVTFSSIDEFLGADIRAQQACVIADVHMPGSNALELPSRLSQRGLDLPVIFVTAEDTDQTRERVRCAGGVSYFRKPVDDQALIDAINWAIGGRTD